MSQANGRSTPIPPRRTVLAGIATAPALAAPALALSSVRPDPIFAAIEHHRAAAEAYTAMVDEQDRLESLIPRHRRTPFWDDGDDPSGDDPRWRAYRNKYSTASDRLKDAQRQLFESPTSIAGLVALIEYMEAERETGNGDWDDAWSLPTQDEMLSALVGTVRRLGAVS